MLETVIVALAILFIVALVAGFIMWYWNKDKAEGL
jgi:hypothetical protein